MKNKQAILLKYESEQIIIAQELRPAHFLGPQAACHEQHCELCLIEIGEEHMRTGSVQAAQNKGQFSWIDAGVEHSSWSENSPVQETILHFPKKSLREVRRNLKLNSGGVPHGIYDSPALLRQLVNGIKQAVRSPQDTGQQLLIDSLAQSVQVFLLTRFSGHAPQDISENNARGDKGLRWVEERLRSEMREDLSLEQLARTANMSKFHLVRSFKRRYGLPPYAYLIRLRLEKAVELMQCSDLSLTEIAHELGFGSSSRFSESFKRQYGLPPSRWRLQSGAISGKAMGNM